MSARAEQLVLEYLSRAADAAHGSLRSDERLRFIARLRASIEQQRRAVGAYEPAAVRRVLAAFGDPADQVARECRRLRGPEPEAAAGGGPPAAPPVEPVTSGAPAGPVPGPPPPQSARQVPAPVPGAAGPAARDLRRTPAANAFERIAAPTRRREPPAQQRPPAPAQPPPAPALAPAPAQAPPAPAQPPSAEPGPEPARSRPARRAQRAGAGQRALAHPQGAAPAGQAPAFDLGMLLRRFRREVLALALLGPGGVALPFLLWPIGAVIALTSWVWSRPEKLVGLFGPPLVFAAGIGVVGTLNKNPSIPVDLHAYTAAVAVPGQLLVRVAAGAGAVFLGARLVRACRVTIRRSAGR